MKKKFKKWFTLEALKEFWRYGQVRIVAVVVGIAWTTLFVDYFGFSGFLTGIIYVPTIGVATYLWHKAKGAQF